MRGNSLFWGAILILIGILLLLSNLGILNINIWGVFWPAALILAGLWVLFGTLFRRGAGGERRSIPLEGAQRARVSLHHGGGRLDIHAGAEAGELASGQFGGGLDLRTQHNSDVLEADLRLPPQSWGPFNWFPGALDWSVGLNEEIPLSLNLETGAGEARLDLTDLHVSDLRLQTGASSTEIRLPAHAGMTQVEVHSGAASTRLLVPEGVAARIRFEGALSSVNVDQTRFPRSGGVYQSPDYETAANRVDLRLESGVGSVEVR